MASISQTSTVWYIIYTFSRAEKKVYEELGKRGYESYLPLQTETRLWSDRKKKVDIPFISSYVFVKCSANDFIHIRRIKGVSTLLSDMKRKPLRIQNQVISNLKFILDNAEQPVSFVSENLEVGDKVEVIKGKLKGMLGEIMEKNGEYRFFVRLEQLGCVVMDMARSCLKTV